MSSSLDSRLEDPCNTDSLPSPDGPKLYLLVTEWESPKPVVVKSPLMISVTLQKTAAEVILVDGDKTEMTWLPKGDRVAGCTPCREVGSTKERHAPSSTILVGEVELRDLYQASGATCAGDGSYIGVVLPQHIVLFSSSDSSKPTRIFFLAVMLGRR